MGRTEDFIESAFSEEERQELLKNNKYWNAEDGEFDPTDIIVEKHFPKFNNQGDKFRCVMSVASWLSKRQYGIDGIAENLAEWLSGLDWDMQALFLRQQHLPLLEEMAAHEAFHDINKQLLMVLTNE